MKCNRRGAESAETDAEKSKTKVFGKTPILWRL
jgi:hypothetical protein